MDWRVFVGLVGLVWGLLILLAILLNRRRDERIRQAAIELGFHRVETPEKAFLDQIARLYRLTDRKYELKNVFRWIGNDCDVYVYDLYDKSDSEGRKQRAWCSIAIVSPQLRLPRFGVYPKAAGMGIGNRVIGGAVNTLVAGLVFLSGGKRIPFDSHPEFDRRYAVVGDNETDVRNTLSTGVLSRLSQTKELVIGAERQILVLANGELQNSFVRQEELARILETVVEEGLILFDLLRVSADLSLPSPDVANQIEWKEKASRGL